MTGEIIELLLLPPLAIGRCGSSTEPMDNYEAQPDDRDPAAYRKLIPAETLNVDVASGRITGATTPTAVRFRDAAGRIRPVAPFFELWAHLDGGDHLQPVTIDLLRQWNLTPSDVAWRVRVGNHKIARRTGQPADNIDADTGAFSDHAARRLSGRAANFLPEASVPLGAAQYIEPTPEFPEVRLRFTPAAGSVYGSRRADDHALDPNVAAQVYDGSRGTWPAHADEPRDLATTVPPGLYARADDPATQRSVNCGYLDDTCDGVVEASLSVRGASYTAFARIAVGPPDFAPDSFHVRTLADELEQIVLGPQVTGQVATGEIIDLVRRSLETLRLMNTEQLDVTSGSGFGAEAAYVAAIARHAPLLAALNGLNALPGSPEHERAFHTLQGLARRARTYLQTGDFTPTGRRKMPALMRGSDDRLLALTRRQLGKMSAHRPDEG